MKLSRGALILVLLALVILLLGLVQVIASGFINGEEANDVRSPSSRLSPGITTFVLCRAEACGGLCAGRWHV